MLDSINLSEYNGSRLLSYLSEKTQSLWSHITRERLLNAWNNTVWVVTVFAESLFASAIFGMHPTICLISGLVGLLYPDDGLHKNVNDFFHKLFSHRTPFIATILTTAWLTWLAPHVPLPILSALYMVSLGCRIRSYITDTWFKTNPNEVNPAPPTPVQQAV